MGDRLTVATMTDVTRWAAAECARQESGELSVAWMVEAWVHARKRQLSSPTMGDVVTLGIRVDPARNHAGFRTTPVRVGETTLAWNTVVAGVRQVVDNWGVLEAGEVYLLFEETHPFNDGNGRVGSILYNWHRGSLAHPVAPPDYWVDGTTLGGLQAARRRLNARIAGGGT